MRYALVMQYPTGLIFNGMNIGLFHAIRNSDDPIHELSACRLITQQLPRLPLTHTQTLFQNFGSTHLISTNQHITESHLIFVSTSSVTANNVFRSATCFESS